MRRAMADAEVGDDVYGEDPTVNALEEAFAARVGKDAAIFVPSGTMANQLALRLLTRPGDLVVAGPRQHIVAYEGGAAGRNAGVQFHLVPDDDGTVRAADRAMGARSGRPSPSPRQPDLCREHPHAGQRRPVAPRRAPAGLGRGRRKPASPCTWTAPGSGTPRWRPAPTAAQYAATVTTVMCCLSKGLCAPVGSLLAGPSDVMASARDERARLGGGMRQAGIIAAAGLVALDTMVERLAEDHRRARRLADVVSERWPEAGCRPEPGPDQHRDLSTPRRPTPSSPISAPRAFGPGPSPPGWCAW